MMIDSATLSLALAAASDVLVAVSRTMTGGDSYAQCHSLLFNPSLVLLAAETALQVPTCITVHGSSAFIESVNTYRLCSMTTGTGTGIGGGSDGFGGSAGGGRSSRGVYSPMGGSDSPASSPTSGGGGGSSGVEVWAWVRCRSREFVSYAPSAPSLPANAGSVASAAGSSSAASSVDSDAAKGLASAPLQPQPQQEECIPNISLDAFVAPTAAPTGTGTGRGTSVADDSAAAAAVTTTIPSVRDEKFAAVLAKAATSASARLTVTLVRCMDVQIDLGAEHQ